MVMPCLASTAVAAEPRRCAARTACLTGGYRAGCQHGAQARTNSICSRAARGHVSDAIEAASHGVHAATEKTAGQLVALLRPDRRQRENLIALDQVLGTEV